MMSQPDELLGIVDNIAKIKRSLNGLRELTNTRPIDRDRCIQMLSELYAPFSALTTSLIIYLSARQREFGKLILERLRQGQYTPLADGFTYAINMMMEICRQTTLFNDDAITYAVSVFYGMVTSLLSSIEQLLEVPTGLKHLTSLIERYGFDNNWIVSVAHLAAMEVAVNRKLGELGINVGSGEFKDRVNALLRELERRGVQLGELEKLLPQAFWRLRNEVIHGGYTPSDEELQIIVTAVSNLLEKIGALRSP